MITIKEAILVEGRYDKNTLSQVVDALILTTGGFSIFNDKKQQQLILNVAKKQGLIVLTDSDAAGFVIRNFIRAIVPAQYLKHAYIPDIYGKERRKNQASKEGKLGVEGMRPEILLECLQKAGMEADDTSEGTGERITKTDFYCLGLTGKTDSALKRKQLIESLNLPEHITTNALLDYLNVVTTREDFMALSSKEKESEALL